MVVDMELQEAKDSLLELIKEKDKIEAEIQALLDSTHVGMNEPLVDAEGYPRQDIDVYQVRHMRHNVICLRNDHSALMKKIEEGLHQYHALARENNAPQDVIDLPSSREAETLEPFLRVNLVSPGSPAESAGLQVEDLILEFGYLSYRNFKALTDIKHMVETHVHKILNVKVKRKSDIIVLRLTPQRWQGEGVLGCRVIPLEAVER